MTLPEKGIYRHFKGNLYELIDFAIHSETQETMVVYRPMYGERKLWVRPLAMWSETVERDGMVYTRFTKVEADSIISDDDVPPPPPEDAYAFVPPEDEYAFVPPEDDHAQLSFEDIAGDSFAPDTDSARTDESGGDKYAVLKRVYGYDSFREGQDKIIDSILSGRDTFAVLPTGGGKSICYQVPGLIMQGLTIVVSPLISLMADQVQALKQNGVGVAYINSSLTERQITEVYRRLEQGAYRIIYVAPERLLTPRFLKVLGGIRVAQLAIDEAHCISQWGQDFRPSYLQIPEFIKQLPHRPVVSAFTATATEKVREDVVRILGLKKPERVVTGFDRKNLYLAVRRPSNKMEELVELLNSYAGFSGIVYCSTRKTVDELHQTLTKKRFSVTKYHAGLDEDERAQNQSDFINDRKTIIIATNAFGMGIDKPDVRFVIHYNMPGDIESYYQEAGRAGRDGERSDCILLYNGQDYMIRSYMIDRMGEESELSPKEIEKLQDRARTRLNIMNNYCKTTNCLRKTILNYFGQDAAERCNYCSSCLEPKDMYDVTEAGMAIAQCVIAMRGRFGKAMVINTLRGSKEKALLQRHLDANPQYGALAAYSTENVRYIIEAMEQNGVIEVTGGDYPLLTTGPKMSELLSGGLRIEAHLEPDKKAARSGRTQRKQPENAREDAELFKALRAFRMKMAERNRVAPYMVFPDAALHDMCAKKPVREEQMLEIKGVGEKKYAKYGKVFTEFIAEWVRENG